MIPAEQREQLLKDLIEKNIEVIQLDIKDDSYQHRNHTGHGGGSHFTVRVVSELFRDMSLIERHQAIYQAVGEYMGKEFHALSINAKTPEEV